MKAKLYCSMILLFYLCSCNKISNQPPWTKQGQWKDKEKRFVENNTLYSVRNPVAALKIDTAFCFIGSFDFSVQPNPDEDIQPELRNKDIADGERFVFADIKDSCAKRLIIIQFEGFLANNTLTYNYSFEKALAIGGIKFKNNAWFYNDSLLVAERPTSEAATTRRLLTSQGIIVPPEFMMTRFVMLPDTNRRHEMIISYIEMARDKNFSLRDYEKDVYQKQYIDSITVQLKNSALQSFQIQN